MTEQTIDSADMTLRTMFQDFYRVPDYQREYVWGQFDKRGAKGDEVDQFLSDINGEFQSASEASAPEYFIGTIVVCPVPGAANLLDLIDGQQRVTTAFLTLCAIRDFFTDAGQMPPNDLPGQIAASSTDWQGDTQFRERLDLQYEDSRGVLAFYAHGRSTEAPRTGSRSITNLASAYDTIREFLRTDLKNDLTAVKRFYGFFTNKVKLIRIQTSSVAKALKIFETINDRGLGLDAMDLLKNLLFMSATANQFDELKRTWKQMTEALYTAGEKPLRFLRYFIFADHEVPDNRLQEDDIYDWFQHNADQTGHLKDPLGFAKRLREAAKVYAKFVSGQNPNGDADEGVKNTRILGGNAIRQHYILLLAARNLDAASFATISSELEQLMFVYLMTDTSTRYYERELIDGAKKLRHLSPADVPQFLSDFFAPAKQRLKADFINKMVRLRSGDTRGFRLRYLLAKLTQTVDGWAYGTSGPHGVLSNYYDGHNDIEHILAVNASSDAREEYGSAEDIEDETRSLGNLAFIERPINQLLGVKPYSEKALVYAQSQFLLAKCQASRPTFGVADQITRVVSELESFPVWNSQAVVKRQQFLTQLASRVWGLEVI